MPFFRNHVNHLNYWLLPILICWAGCFCPLWGAERYIVKPIEELADTSFLPAQAWPDGDDEQSLIIKTAYLRGIFDALQYASWAPDASIKVMTDLSGLTLDQLVVGLDNYYRADPRRRQTPPVSVLLGIIGPAQNKTVPSGSK